MPSAATKAKRAAAKAEKDAEKAALEARLDAAVARMEVEQPAAVAVVPSVQPPSSTSLVESSITSMTEVPSPSSKQLAQPVRGSLTPRRTNIEYLLEAASPGGTTMIKESFKRAAATPVGEDAEARARRLAAERARLCRARARLEAKLNPPPPLTTEEVDMALSVHELSTALERAGLGDIGTALSLRCYLTTLLPYYLTTLLPYYLTACTGVLTSRHTTNSRQQRKLAHWSSLGSWTSSL